MTAAPLLMAEPVDARTKRNLLILVAAQGFIGAQMPIIFIVAGLAGQSLVSNPCWATLPITCIVVGSMLAASPLSLFMQHFGRRAGFILGAFAGALGATIGAYGLMSASFPLFLLGSLLTGIYMSAQAFYRFAATDTATPSFRPKAISWVMAGGLISAVFGPFLVKVTAQSMMVPFLGCYLAVIGLNIFGMLLFMGLDVPHLPKPEKGTDQGRSRIQMLKDPRIAVAIICATVSYALMNLVMTSTPLAVVGCGFQTADAADVVTAHVLAMYAPAFITGHVIARIGVERVVAIGLVLLSFAGIVALMGIEMMNFYGALILLGVGWNFGFIGSTAMLSAHHSPQERGRVQGLNDLLVFAGVSVASLSSGILMNCSGASVIDGWDAVNIAMLPLLTMAGAALIWLSLLNRKAQA
jgi:MFS family permease